MHGSKRLKISELTKVEHASATSVILTFIEMRYLVYTFQVFTYV